MTAPPLQVDVTWHGGDAAVRLRGDLDLSTAAELRNALADACQVAGAVTVHAEELEFLDLAGVDALLALRQALVARGADLVLRAPSAPVARLLALLDDPLPVT